MGTQHRQRSTDGSCRVAGGPASVASFGGCGSSVALRPPLSEGLLWAATNSAHSGRGLITKRAPCNCVIARGDPMELPRCDVATAHGRVCAAGATYGGMFSSSKWLQWNSDETARYLSRHRSGRFFRDGEVFAGRRMSRRGSGPGWTLWTMRTASCLVPCLHESPAAQRNPFSYRSIRSAPAPELPP